MWQLDNFVFEHILLKDHAVIRMIERDISQDDIMEILEGGEIIEDYPQAFPYPAKLSFKIVNGRPLHLVLAYCSERFQGIIVSLYEPDSNHFKPDHKTRK